MTHDLDQRKEATLRVAPKAPVSLTEQWGLLEKIETELRDRIRRERTDIIAAYEARRVSIVNDYNQRITEEIAKLEKLRDIEMAELNEQTQEKIREHELLAKRMAKDGTVP